MSRQLSRREFLRTTAAITASAGLTASLGTAVMAAKRKYDISLAGWSLHVSLDFVANWPMPLFWPVTSERYSLGLLSQDFSWRLDMLLVIGLAATLWDRAMPHARPIFLITWVAMAGARTRRPVIARIPISVEEAATLRMRLMSNKFWRTIARSTQAGMAMSGISASAVSRYTIQPELGARAMAI